MAKFHFAETSAIVEVIPPVDAPKERVVKAARRSIARHVEFGDEIHRDPRVIIRELLEELGLDEETIAKQNRDPGSTVTGQHIRLRFASLPTGRKLP